MALTRFVITANVTVPPGTPTPVANEGFGVVSWAGPVSAWADGEPYTFLEGTIIELDPATPAGLAIQVAIGQGTAGVNLRAYVQGSDDVGHAGLSN
jgi:hypothetical protein